MAFDVVAENPAIAGAKLKLPLCLASREFFLAGPESIWGQVIKPIIDDMASRAGSDYTTQEVWRELFAGTALLYLGNLDTPTLDFVGFTIVRVLDGKTPHIWIVYVDPKFRNSESILEGFGYVVQQMKSFGATCLTACAQDEQTHSLFVKLGFVNTFRIYSRSI